MLQSRMGRSLPVRARCRARRVEYLGWGLQLWCFGGDLVLVLAMAVAAVVASWSLSYWEQLAAGGL